MTVPSPRFVLAMIVGGYLTLGTTITARLIVDTSFEGTGLGTLNWVKDGAGYFYNQNHTYTYPTPFFMDAGNTLTVAAQCTLFGGAGVNYSWSVHLYYLTPEDYITQKLVGGGGAIVGPGRTGPGGAY